MTERDRIRLIKFMDDWTAQKLAEGPAACRRWLIDHGFYDEAGNLTPQYGGKE